MSPSGLGGYLEPHCPAVPQPRTTMGFPSAPAFGNCVLVHVLSPTGRVGVCKRFALICLNNRAAQLVRPGVHSSKVQRGDAAHLGHGERA